jgi:hypothetical protein
LTVLELHIGTPADRCRENNKKLLADKDNDGGYEEEDFENLIFRYEEPNGMTRWDSPLFIVVEEDETPPCDQIWEAMVGSDGKMKVVKPNLATVLVRTSTPLTWPVANITETRDGAELPIRTRQDDVRHPRPDNGIPERSRRRRRWRDSRTGRREAHRAPSDTDDPAATPAHTPPVHHDE